MKKKLKIVLASILGAILCLSTFSFVGCGEELPEVDVTAPVYSNGGTVVQYDGYVYFINGIPDYTDDSGKSNVYGNVVKGGLYRAKINASRGTVEEEERKDRNLVDGQIDLNADGLSDVMDFEYEKWDYKQLGEYRIGGEDDPALVTDASGKTVQNIIPTNGGRSEYRIKVEPVIAKKIGTSGYADGGFWIYDGIVYFASPDDARNTEGEVLDERAAFFSYNLKDGALTKIRSATEVGTSVPYSFYKRGDRVYLVTYENYYADADAEEKDIKTGYLVSTEITNGAPGETKEIASDVKSAYFPKRETYVPGTKANTAADYVYYTRSVDSNDATSTVSTLEIVAPDGTNLKSETADLGIVIQNPTGELQIEGVAGNYLYYRNPVNTGVTRLEYTDLYTQLKAFDETADVTYSATESQVLVNDVSAYTSLLPVTGENGAYVLGVKSDGVENINSVGERVKVFSGNMTLLGFSNGRAYGTYSGSSGEESGDDSSESTTLFVSFSAYADYRDRTLELLGSVSPNVSTFKLDFFEISYANASADTAPETYVSFISDYHAAATSYLYINKVAGVNNTANAGGYVGVKLGRVADFDQVVISCADNTCMNWTHDHSSWDNAQSSGDEEEGEEGGEGEF